MVKSKNLTANSEYGQSDCLFKMKESHLFLGQKHILDGIKQTGTHTHKNTHTY